MVYLGPDGFDASMHEPIAHPIPIPTGKYPAAIVESEWKATRAGNGEYLELRFEIIAGEHHGRAIFVRLNLTNVNPRAIAFARSNLSAICRAVGVLRLRDSSELHGIPLVIDVRLERRPDTRELVNVIRGYFAREDAPAIEEPTAADTPWF
jgi:hypothetical protein